jgi:hypothetical protein
MGAHRGSATPRIGSSPALSPAPAIMRGAGKRPGRNDHTRQPPHHADRTVHNPHRISDQTCCATTILEAEPEVLDPPLLAPKRGVVRQPFHRPPPSPATAQSRRRHVSGGRRPDPSLPDPLKCTIPPEGLRSVNCLLRRALPIAACLLQHAGRLSGRPAWTLAKSHRPRGCANSAMIMHEKTCSSSLDNHGTHGCPDDRGARRARRVRRRHR